MGVVDSQDSELYLSPRRLHSGHGHRRDGCWMCCWPFSGRLLLARHWRGHNARLLNQGRRRLQRRFSRRPPNRRSRCSLLRQASNEQHCRSQQQEHLEQFALTYFGTLHMRISWQCLRSNVLYILLIPCPHVLESGGDAILAAARPAPGGLGMLSCRKSHQFQRSDDNELSRLQRGFG